MTIHPVTVPTDEPALPCCSDALTRAEPLTAELTGQRPLTSYTLGVGMVAASCPHLRNLADGVQAALDQFSGGQIVLSAWENSDLGIDEGTGDFAGALTSNVVGKAAAVLPVSSGVPVVEVHADGLYFAGSKLGEGLPTQTGQTGKYLKTNGTAASWQTVPNPDLTNVARTDAANTFTGTPQTISPADSSRPTIYLKSTPSTPTNYYERAAVIKWDTALSSLGLTFQSNGTENARFQDNGYLTAQAFSTIGAMEFGDYYLSRSSSGARMDFGGTVSVPVLTVRQQLNNGTSTTLAVKAVVGQSQNLQEWQGSTGSAKGYVSADGGIYLVASDSRLGYAGTAGHYLSGNTYFRASGNSPTITVHGDTGVVDCHQSAGGVILTAETGAR